MSDTGLPSEQDPPASTSLPHARISTPAAAVVHRGYPWVFAGQIMSCDRTLAPGDLVEVQDPEGQRLGFAYANPKTQLALRMLYSPAAGARYPDGMPDERVELGRKLDRAWTRRQKLKLDTDAVRLIWSEAGTIRPDLSHAFIGMLDRNAEDLAGVNCYSAEYLAPALVDAAVADFYAKHGADAVLCTSLSETQDAAHFGRRGVVPAAPLAAVLTHGKVPSFDKI